MIIASMTRALSIFVVVGGVAIASPAVAAPLFDAQNFQPSSTSNGYLNVDSPFPVGHLGGYAGLFLSYAKDPLVLRDSSGKIAPGGRLVEHQLGLTLVGALSVFRRAEFGLTLPFVPYQATDGTLTPSGKIAAGAIGDLKLDFKVLIWRREWAGRHQLGLGVLGGANFPTGSTSAFAGHGGFGVHLRLLLGYMGPRASATLSFGALLRESRKFYDLNVTHQITIGLAGRVKVWRGLDVMGEVVTAIGVGLPKNTSLQASEAPTEVLAGLRYRTRIGLAPLVAAGGGLGRGYGTPIARAIFGLQYTNPGKAVTLVDRKPNNDRTPDRPPTKPDPTPPPTPPTPPPTPAVVDSDGDGIVDSMDGCPDKKGVMENRGCPDMDSDGDGIVDRLDRCPFDPENYNGVEDEDGCDDGGGPLVRIEGDSIEIKDGIGFESGTLLDSKSFKTLDALGALLRNHPELKKLRVEGHTDNKGSVIENLDLSRDRASTVRRFLVENHRVDGARLIAQGFGADRPIADNKTPQGRAKNRRIEIVILERDSQ